VKSRGTPAKSAKTELLVLPGYRTAGNGDIQDNGAGKEGEKANRPKLSASADGAGRTAVPGMGSCPPAPLLSFLVHHFGNKLATALPVRPQRGYNVNRCGTAANSIRSMVFHRQVSVTPMPRGSAGSRFES